MTRRLYYTNSYLTTAQSRVSEASEDGLRVALDETIFYPTSGGQPFDLGTLNRIPVVEVIDEEDTVWHVLASPLRQADVDSEIDWPRRYDHMQQHTGQHLLSAVFEELYKIPTLSFRMSEEASTIELGVKELTEAQTQAVLLRATELARANLPVVVTFEEADTAQALRKASQRSGILRIVEITGIDRSACGGTHVANLAEVLPLQIRDAEKLRGNTRISFVCGNRALTRAQLDFGMLNRMARSLATTIDKVEDQIANLQQRLAAAEKDKQRLESEAATRAGIELYNTTEPNPVDGIRRHFSTRPNLHDNVRKMAKAFASQPQSILLIHSNDGILLACSSDSGVNAGALLKKVLTKYGATGGGSSTLGQGSLTNPAMIEHLKQELGMFVG